MKKTLLVTMDFAPQRGGVAAYWKRVYESLPAEHFVVLTSVPSQTAEPRIVRQTLFSRLIWPRWIKTIVKTWRVYKKQGCEQLLVGQLLPLGTVALVLHRLCGIPYVVQLYGMDIAQAANSARKKRLAAMILRRAQAIIVNSEATGKLLASVNCSDLAYTVVYPIPEMTPANGELQEQLRQRHHLRGKKVVITIGRLVPRKGQDKVIMAWHQVLAAVPNAVYVILGDGPDRDRLATLLRAQPDIMWVREASDELKNAWLSLADLLIMPSRASCDDVEGFGMVFLEAGAYGKPVIGGRSGGVVEAIKEGKTGLLVDPLNEHEIAQALIRVLRDQSLAQSLGEAGKAQYLALSWQSQLDRLESCL